MLERVTTGYRIPRTVFAGRAETEGDGVEVRRLIGVPELDMVDPFLLLDVFSVNTQEDRSAGFSPHPHRGFETVTYLLAGEVRHADSAGHESVLQAGGVQWMTAGRGVVHSEMPEGKTGLVAGLQLWVNLPKSHKMTDANYQEFRSDEIPVEERGSQVTVKVVAGTTGRGTTGPVRQPLTEPRYFDFDLGAGAAVLEPVPSDHNAFIYMINGSLEFPGDDLSVHPLGGETLAVLSHGTELRVSAGTDGARFLLVSGRPLRETVARSGGIVMNTLSEVHAAQEDFRRGRLAG